ncbi:MAG: hypothetical protein WC676_01030 [Candidatus Omnitrophota bacterium]
MFRKLSNTLSILICGILVFQLMGCGTILYPERRGQRAGHIDAGVVLLDGIGLLFGIIPGVIAFAVDFSNGTIYLPGTSRGSLDLKNLKQVKFNSKHSSWASIERIVQRETGCDLKLHRDRMEITKLKSIDDMMAHFAQASPGMQSNRIAAVR